MEEITQEEQNRIAIAIKVQKNLGTVPRNKTIAGIATGERSLSGWTETLGYSQATSQVIKYSQEIGHSLKPAGPLDKGVLGRYNASHAEKQLSVIAPNQPIGVSSKMCNDCQEYFKALARYTGMSQVVADPEWVRIFRPDGSVQELPNQS